MACSELALLRNTLRQAPLPRGAGRIQHLGARSVSTESPSNEQDSPPYSDHSLSQLGEGSAYARFSHIGGNMLTTGITHCFEGCGLNADGIKIHTSSVGHCLRFATYLSALPSVSYRMIGTMTFMDGRPVVETFDLFLSSLKGDFSITEACSNYLEELCRSGKVQYVDQLLKHFRSRQIHLSLKTYNHMLAVVAGKEEDPNLAFNIFKDLLLSGSPPDLSSYTNLAKSFHRVENPETVLRFTLELSEIATDKDPTVMNRIIFFLGKTGQVDKALMIYDYMKDHSCEVDTVTFNTVLALLGKNGQIERMLSEFSIMKELGHSPDVVTFNTIISSLRIFGRLDLCRVFVKEMSDKGIELDLITYTAIINSMGRAGHAEDAVRVLDEMKRLRIQPSIYVYRALISNLKKAGKFVLANSLLEEMKSVASRLLGPKDIEQIKRTKR